MPSSCAIEMLIVLNTRANNNINVVALVAGIRRLLKNAMVAVGDMYTKNLFRFSLPHLPLAARFSTLIIIPLPFSSFAVYVPVHTILLLRSRYDTFLPIHVRTNLLQYLVQ